MKPYYKLLSRNQNNDLHTDKNYFIFDDIIPLTVEERNKLDESYRAFITGLIFGVFDIIPDTDNETGEVRLIYKYSWQEGITVKRSEQLGVESRLINRLFEENGKDALRYIILKDCADLYEKLVKSGRIAEILVLYEYYYEKVYPLFETESAGQSKKKIETYQYRIVRSLAREIENSVKPEFKNDFIKKVIDLKNNLDSFSVLCPDKIKRVIKFSEISGDNISAGDSRADIISSGININKLKELKEAFELGLISEGELNNAKKKFLNN